MKRSSSFSVSRRGALAASTVAALGAAMVAVPLLAVSASATQPGNDGSHKVTICHRTNSDTNPYVVETVDIASSGLLKAGHNDHTGDVWSSGMKADHDKWGDIIPAYHYEDGDFTFDFPGLNWGADGKAIYDAGCTVVLPTPTESSPTPTETPEPTPSETTATPEPSESETTASAEPTDTPTPSETTATPEPTPTETTATPEPTPTETTATPEPTPSESTATEVPTTAPATPESSAPEASASESTDPGMPSTGGTPATLPKTGSDSAAMLALAAGLVTMGAASIVVARRRTEVETD